MDIRLRYVDENFKQVERDFDLLFWPSDWIPNLTFRRAWPIWALNSMNSASVKPVGSSPWKRHDPVFSSRALPGAQRYTRNGNTGERRGFHVDGAAVAVPQYPHYDEKISDGA